MIIYPFFYDAFTNNSTSYSIGQYGNIFRNYINNNTHTRYINTNTFILDVINPD